MAAKNVSLPNCSFEFKKVVSICPGNVGQSNNSNNLDSNNTAVIYVAAPGMCFAPLKPNVAKTATSTITDEQRKQNDDDPTKNKETKAKIAAKRGPTPKYTDNYTTLHGKMQYSKSSKRIIMNVYYNTNKLYPTATITQRVMKTSLLTGVSEGSINRIRQEYHTQGKFYMPSKRKRVVPRLEKFTGFELCYIRNKVHEFYRRNEIPTVKKIHSEIQKENFRQIGSTTLRKILQDIGFKHERLNFSRHFAIIERDDLISFRRQYLRSIKDYRSQGKTIYFQHETRLNDDAKNQSNKITIVSHIGSSNGFVEDCLLIFNSEVGEDQDEIHSVVFNKWMEKVFTKIEPNSVIVMDNASYDVMNLEKYPNSSWSKPNIEEWLTEKEIGFTEDSLKAELLSIVNNVKDRFKMHHIDERARELGFEVLRLPTHHCQLNLIEMIWSQHNSRLLVFVRDNQKVVPNCKLTFGTNLKTNQDSVCMMVRSHVKLEDQSFRLNELVVLLQDGIRQVSPQTWANHVNLVLEEEEKLWNIDYIIENSVETILKNDKTGECSTSESSDEDDEQDDDEDEDLEDGAVIEHDEET